MHYKMLQKLLEKNRSQANDSKMVTISREMFHDLLVCALRQKNEFDEKFYLTMYPDIRDAIRKRKIESGAEHYFKSGYFEGRIPKKFSVDEKFYLANNPDVAAGIKKGTVKNAQQHFDSNGFQEGRAPFEDYSLF